MDCLLSEYISLPLNSPEAVAKIDSFADSGSQLSPEDVCAVAKCLLFRMEVCADKAFWKLCLESFLNELRPDLICNADLLPEALLKSNPIKKKVHECLTDDHIRSEFIVLLQKSACVLLSWKYSCLYFTA
ncbi:unnamed protein product [Dibothriocephalus latus]|uniref:Uncharacterized protein n=1 Tax=Dibothriocephalus latus TaxID=60516 RepID=A0A3P7PYG5_DIBLA|nr:unnamed protein product [Dibothriocephalus latus]